jgi:iron complex transport system permease protein
MSHSSPKVQVSVAGKADFLFNPARLQLILVLLLFVVSIISLVSGQMKIQPGTVLKILLSRLMPLQTSWPATLESVVVDVRLPRLLAGILIGCGLSISGASFQRLFRNPLVDPHILGVSAGAGFGAALAILAFGNIYMVQVLSFRTFLSAFSREMSFVFWDRMVPGNPLS